MHYPDLVEILRDLLNSEDLLFWMVWLFQIYEWSAMYLIITAQKDHDADEILYDIENPPMFKSEISDGVIYRNELRNSVHND